MTIYERLNRQRGITNQNPKAKFRVLYNTSGTYLVSAVLKTRTPFIKVNNSRIRLNGTIVDHTLYSFETDNEDEAYYLSTILNCRIIDEIIKPAQARGQFGPRHIHKKPFEIAIPKFDAKNEIQKHLSHLGKICTACMQ